MIRIDHGFRAHLFLDWQALQPLELHASQTAQLAELAPIVEGKPDVSKIEAIDLQKLAAEFRTQRIVFETARDVYDLMQPNWPGGKALLLAQLVRLIEQFIRSDSIRITPVLFRYDDLKRRIIITLNMTKVAQHVWEGIRFENTERLEPVFDRDRPIRSTGDMATWYTGKPCGRAARSHINFCVYDGTWEASEAFVLDHADEVAAWVKNDHLGFEVFYVHRGRGAEVSPGFPDPVHFGRHAGSGGQGARQRPGPDQAPIPGRMGTRRQCPWRLRSLGLGRVESSQRHLRHPGATCS